MRVLHRANAFEDGKKGIPIVAERTIDGTYETPLTSSTGFSAMVCALPSPEIGAPHAVADTT